MKMISLQKNFLNGFLHPFGISEWDAIKSVNDFSFSLKNKISETGEVNWEDVGILKRDKR